MTPTELTELDRLMATRVMGYQLCPVHPNCNVYWEDAVREIGMIKDWHPTTDIAQAFMVAQKAGYLTLTQGSVAWDARIESRKGSGSAFAVEPALAICLAAKAWLESQ